MKTNLIIFCLIVGFVGYFVSLILIAYVRNPRLRNPFRKPTGRGDWKFVVIPRKTPSGWKSMVWLRKSSRIGYPYA